MEDGHNENNSSCSHDIRGPLGDDETRIQLDGRELDRWEWVGVDQLDDYLIPRLARRVRSLLRGGAGGGTYFEHGTPFPGTSLVS